MTPLKMGSIYLKRMDIPTHGSMESFRTIIFILIPTKYLLVFTGEASVQLGGPNGKIIKFSRGDVLLLPAGTAHKRIKASKDFKIVGAYPNGIEYNTYKPEDVSSDDEYKRIKQEIKKVSVPALDPVQSKGGAVKKYWKTD